MHISINSNGSYIYVPNGELGFSGFFYFRSGPADVNKPPDRNVPPPPTLVPSLISLNAYANYSQAYQK